MRNVGIFFLAAATSLSAGVANAQSPSRSNLYVGGSIGLAYFAEIEGADYDLGFEISGLAGFRWRPDLRIEAELLYEEAEFENSADATELFRLSGSLYKDLDMRLLGDSQPYFGGGIGIVDVDVGNDEDNTELSAHIEGGLSMPIGDGAIEFVPGIRVEYILLDDIDDQVITQLRAGFRLGL